MTTYNLSLDYAGLKAAHRTAALFKDPRGNPDPAILDTVVVKYGSANYFKAKEILKAIENNKIPESMDNDGSGIPTFKILALHYLTTAAYWWMFDSSKMGDKNGFQFVESQAPVLDPTNVVYKTKEIQVSETSWFDLGFNDSARMWVGSKSDDTDPTD